MKNSLFLAVVGTLITLAISAMCGYGLAIYRHEITYSNKVFAVFLLGTLIPGEILTVSPVHRDQRHRPVQQHLGRDPAGGHHHHGIFMYRQHFMSIPLSLRSRPGWTGRGVQDFHHHRDAACVVGDRFTDHFLLCVEMERLYSRL